MRSLTRRMTALERRTLSCSFSVAANKKLDLGAPTFLKTRSPVNVEFQVGGCVSPPLKPVLIRNRYGLPGAKHDLTNSQLPETLSNAREGFPVVVSAASCETGPCEDPVAAARALKPKLDTLLPNHGVVMVYGLESAIRDAKSFSIFMETIKSEYDCRLFMEGRSMTSHDVAAFVRTGSDDHPAYTIGE